MPESVGSAVRGTISSLGELLQYGTWVGREAPGTSDGAPGHVGRGEREHGVGSVVHNGGEDVGVRSTNGRRCRCPSCDEAAGEARSRGLAAGGVAATLRCENCGHVWRTVDR